MQSIALAAFVKTPGYSEVKSRLGASIGAAEAQSFYLACVEDTAALLDEVRKLLPHVYPYWAVAETQACALPMWSLFPAVAQGEGSLGDRIATVFEALIEKHDFVIMLGADAPHITPDAVALAAKRLVSNPKHAVIGPADDGGFYLVGTGSVPASMWRGILYSESTTAEQVALQLGAYAELSFLDPAFDVDDLHSLRKIYTMFREDQLPAHCAALRSWFPGRHF